ncbi:MAG: acyl-CoA reductase-like NAD-dependent aldehyde dehydrogenase, partial [Planctomycetota bacterium]
MKVLDEIKQKSFIQLLDGEFRKGTSGNSLDVIDPASEAVIAEITEASSAEIDL